MSVQLLDKTRKISKFLNNTSGYDISMAELSKLLGELILSNVYIIDYKGKIEGFCTKNDIDILDELYGYKLDDVIEEKLVRNFNSVFSTMENIKPDMIGFEDYDLEKYDANLFPLEISGERVGTIFTYRINNQYDTDDIILGEYIGNIAAIELLHSAQIDGIDSKEKDRFVVLAFKSLSPLERKAAKCIFEELGYKSGNVYTSHIAEKFGVTRSIIVNSIKKMNGAGIVNSKSMGTKGTHIDILNDGMREYLDMDIFE